MNVLDAHVRLGTGRDASLTTSELLATMDRLGIDRALVSPPERCLAVDHREGNTLVADAARASGGRLLAYAVASPWRGRRALAELARAADDGAVALALDPAIQGFDLLDGQVDLLVEDAVARGWPVYVRTGTPSFALPLQLAELAVRHPQCAFVMGKSGATDFWLDARPALERAENLYADTAYGPWDVVLSGLAAAPVGAGRLVFSTDQPNTDPAIERARMDEWPLEEQERAAVLGATLSRLLP
ncbi:amidohydrolase family protein [Conexibacter woesei]|uniref:Amidohydrolase 2 n=1 Tax=Conexibacter woesei (strain DSM 14684 / CCUG 47730 / CIP 108061 / JCM 11494 / NBRC 100937 / ID131577) TaxID=469383 RepID=D3FDC0_CONWI|nr:amidohydrolase family protein [Conexibacter woesei]ADB53512.1 amidohydrolase 2 [Conexibacter woesei DSM 14684]